jgi:hypothetical protein
MLPTLRRLPAEEQIPVRCDGWHGHLRSQIVLVDVLETFLLNIIKCIAIDRRMFPKCVLCADEIIFGCGSPIDVGNEMREF